MIARTVRPLLLVVLLGLFAPVPAARGEEPAGSAPEGGRTEQRPANVPFLFSAFAITWVAVWLYMIRIDRGQRRVEKMLDRMEREGGGAGEAPR